MYEKLKSLDGRHPWRAVAADGYVDYRVRPRPGGRVVYFNYALGRELGLVPANHAAHMDARLERSLLDAFALQIINEYDLAHTPDALHGARPHAYMATRYLQAQHKDKRGRTSGDGRAIWNGTVHAGGMTFDVSSRGTGATRLSPGAQVAGQPVKTGDDSWGYSCGRAELDEMLGTAVMSEVFYRSGLPTERTLCVIDFGDGTAIGVRTAPNLLRPAHIFRYVKQGRRDEVKASLDYFIARQEANGFWTLPSAGEPTARYRKVLGYLARSYGKLAAVLEEEYIFNWLAWDGDNMLASRRDPRLRLDPPVCRQARQVPLRRRRSLLRLPRRAAVLGPRDHQGVRAGGAVHPDGAEAEPAAVQGRAVPARLRPGVRARARPAAAPPAGVR